MPNLHKIKKCGTRKNYVFFRNLQNEYLWEITEQIFISNLHKVKYDEQKNCVTNQGL
jgi:hypothetical protein